MSFATIFISIVYIFILQYVTMILIYASIAVIFLALCGSGAYSFYYASTLQEGD
jgi:hypothetical protein